MNELEKKLKQGCTDAAQLFDYCIQSEGMAELIQDIQNGVRKRTIKDWFKWLTRKY